MAQQCVVHTVTLGELAEVPGTPFAYWAPKCLRQLFHRYPPLDRDVAKQPDKPKIADVKQGLATANDLRFTRYWWEVPVGQIATSREETFAGKPWVPFAKSTGPFFDDIRLVVNWGNDGELIKSYIAERYPYLRGKWQWVVKNEGFYFRGGLRCSRAQSWSRAAQSGWLAVSLLPRGAITDARSVAIVSAGAAFAKLGLLVSRAAAFLVFLQCGEPAGEATHVARIPVPSGLSKASLLASLAHEGHMLLREWSTGHESSTVYRQPWIIGALPTSEEQVGQGGRHRHPFAVKSSPALRERSGRTNQLAQKRELSLLTLRKLADSCVRRERLLYQRLGEIQCQIDDEVYHLYGIAKHVRALIEAELGLGSREPEDHEEGHTPDAKEEGPRVFPKGLVSAQDHICRLAHHLAHECLKSDDDGIVPLHDAYTVDERLEHGLAHRVRQVVRETFAGVSETSIEHDLRWALGKPLEEWLTTGFFGYHIGLYRRRPIIWQVTSRQRGQPAFCCFLYWHKLTADTLRKVRQVYLRPAMDGARRDVQRLAAQLVEQRAAGMSMREQRQTERTWKRAQERLAELQRLDEAIEKVLQPHALEVTSRSDWVKEKVNEIVSQGYRPERDYGVRVNIEPLKQAGILARDADRVKG